METSLLRVNKPLQKMATLLLQVFRETKQPLRHSRSLATTSHLFRLTLQ